MKISGFTLIRNGHKYDYPFLESLKSLHELCGDIYIALGESDDETEVTIKALPYAKIIETTWDEDLRKGGLILSQQTNVALDLLRQNLKDGWAFYLQADEVISDVDFDLIKSDMKLADEQGCDAISFRYFHFWKSYDQVATSKSWYPQEIRAIKVNSDIESYGDAMSFKNYKKVYYSDATIFHYGHVREEEKYDLKIKDFNRWWHSDEDMSKVEESQKKDIEQQTICFQGIHPKYMDDKLAAAGLTPNKRNKVIIIDKESSLDDRFKSTIYADEVISVKSKKELSKIDTQDVLIDLSKGKLAGIFNSSKVPFKMRSKIAREWTKEMYTMFKLSEKGVWLKRK